MAIGEAPPPGPDDRCRTSRPENGRGFALTERYAREVGP
jgi:anti-sigma regulatory factor (Ser/Thr protein kinase)